MRQFGKIFKFELKYYLKNKIFVGITVFLVLLIAGVMFFPRIQELFDETAAEPEQNFIEEQTADGESTGTQEAAEVDVRADSDRPVMLVKGETLEQGVLIADAFSMAFWDYQIRNTEEDVEKIKEQITSGEAECAFVMTSPTEYTYYVDNLSMYDMNTETANEVLKNSYQMSALLKNGMTPEEAEEVMNVYIYGSVESLGKDQMENFFYTYIMIFALYMVILLYGQMVSTNVATEKSSRAMEVLVTSAKPVSMMFGKVLASCLAGFLQLVAVFGTALLCYNLNKSYWSENMIVESIFNIPPELLLYMLVFFILGFLIYAFLFGAIGSTATKLEDINTSTMPLMFLFIIAFMVVVMSMSSGSVENMAIKVCSFIPFTSPMAMFTRIAMSTVPWYEILISIVLLIGSVIGVGVISAKIYRVGVLLYGTTPKLGAILKAVFRA